MSFRDKTFVKACKHGEMDLIEWMLANGTNPNTTHYECTGLHKVCKHSEPWAVDVVTKLIRHGADVDIEYVCWNALDYVLLTTPFQPHIASLLLYSSKLGINRIASDGANYLSACEILEMAPFEFLVDNGIDVNHICADGQTILDSLEETQPKTAMKIQIIEYLRQHGAKLASEL